MIAQNPFFFRNGTENNLNLFCNLYLHLQQHKTEKDVSHHFFWIKCSLDGKSNPTSHSALEPSSKKTPEWDILRR